MAGEAIPPVEDPLHSRAPAALSLLALLSACGGGLVNKDDNSTPDTGPAEGLPNLFVQVEFIDFGEIELTSVATANLTVRNTGTGDLEITETAFTDRAFSTPGLPSLIPAGGSATVNLVFAPSDYGLYEGSFSITSTDPDEEVVEVGLRGSVVSDADGDGYDSVDAGGDDCDDDDAEINPGAEDLWYDGKDSNCDGADDYDQDGDGFQTITWNPDAVNGGGDCQDANADINPNAGDEWYDGIDSDCDGSDDYDRDGDGFQHPLGGGTDCDDDDPEVNRDATEMLNGRDDDCDGDVDNSVGSNVADVAYYGSAAADRMGTSFTVGDLDDDGFAELIVGAPGYGASRGGAAIFDGSAMPASGSLFEDASNSFSGVASGDALGTFVGYLSSFSATGDAHLAVGAPNYNGGYGGPWVIPGIDAATSGDINSAVTLVQGDSSHRMIGHGIAQDLDLDGDGTDDLWGPYWTSSSVSSTPYQWLLYGDATGAFTGSEVDARFSASGNGGIYQRNLSNGGDLNGDGYDDIIVCDHFADLGATNNGGTWALWGQASQYGNTSAANLSSVGALLYAGDNYERSGWTCGIVDDMDGDGDSELWVFNPGTQYIYIFEGGSDLAMGDLDADEAVAMIDVGQNYPQGIRPMGDWTGDGVAEVAVATRHSPIGSSSGGTLMVFDGANAEGEYGLNDAYANISGDLDEGNEAYGERIPGFLGDLNGDGLLDFVSADYALDELDSSGAVLTNQRGGVMVSYGAE